MIKFAFESIWRTVIVMTPLLGVWLASSLAGHFGGPRWAAIAAGILLFPLLPLTWEAWAARRKKKRDDRRKERGKEPRKAFLSTTNRVVLRTLVVNFAFLSTLVWLFPQAVFPALSTRGAWFLDGVEGDSAETARRGIYFAAGKLEWLYKVTNPNPYAGLGEGASGEDVDPGGIRPGAYDDTSPISDPKKPDPNKPDPKKPDPNKPDPNKPDPNKPDSITGPKAIGKVAWPQSTTLHAKVESAPEHASVTVAQLGAHFRTIKNQRERVRAMHDWVATHISYDYPSIEDGTYPRRQRAERVLRDRRGVCAGYSNLMSALGKVTGDRIVYVTGYSRDNDGEIDGPNGHAWNAVEIEGAWYLMDVTWDSGLSLGRKKQEMKTTYFLTPPTAFALDHFPDDPKWQLLRTPLSRGEFLRQPPMHPLSVSYGLKMLSPDNGRGISNSNRPALKVANPKKFFLLGKALHESGRQIKCETTRAATSDVVCPLKTSGRYRVKLYANDKQAGTYAYMGTVIVDQR